jgi:hypothetical protein
VLHELLSPFRHQVKDGVAPVHRSEISNSMYCSETFLLVSSAEFDAEFAALKIFRRVSVHDGKDASEVGMDRLSELSMVFSGEFPYNESHRCSEGREGSAEGCPRI